MTDALLEREDCNVIVVNWNPGARVSYPQAAGNTRLVGVQTAVLIRFLITSSSGSASFANRFYIVGYSLGAHVAGYAGSYLKERGMTLGRITGLDPAGPLFKKNDVRFRLDRGDAAYVDVIHVSLLGIGASQANGHTEFFPNGSKIQNGCGSLDLSCSHRRAYEFYIASVQNRCSWKAYPCSSFSDFEDGMCRTCNGACPTMGYGADHTKRLGYFYLKTNGALPFCGLR